MSSFLEALTAAARCHAGAFYLHGRKLLPLSLHHLALLDELIGEDLYLAAPDAATREIIAEVCSHRTPTLVMARLVGKPLERALLGLAQWDPDEETATWLAYRNACLDSRPKIRTRESGGHTQELRAPYALLVHTFLARKLPALAAEGTWYDMAASEALWRYYALREQEEEHTLFAQNQAPDPTPEEQAAEAAKDAQVTALSAKIFAQAEAKRASAERAFFTPASAKNDELARIDAEQQRLLDLAATGRLADDLTELTAGHTADA